MQEGGEVGCWELSRWEFPNIRMKSCTQKGCGVSQPREMAQFAHTGGKLNALLESEVEPEGGECLVQVPVRAVQSSDGLPLLSLP